MSISQFFNNLQLALKHLQGKGNEIYLKLKQIIALEKIYLGKDLFVNLPTGYGKSLIYQLGVFLIGYKLKVQQPIVIIVAPLNSLIEDQCNKLNALDIKTAVFKSENEPEGDYNFIFAHAEWISSASGRRTLLKPFFQKNVCLFAIDEAHCIIEWGKDFRPSYARLGCVSSYFPNVPCIALTATAPKKYFKEIVSCVNMKSPVMVSMLPDRRNIKYSVQTRPPASKGVESYESILKPLARDLCLKRVNFPLTIVYLPLRYCGVAYRLLEAALGPVDQYDPPGSGNSEDRLFGQFHSAYTKSMKSLLLVSLTSNGKCRILFSTDAVGMGVDAPAIRNIIHIGVPRSIEQYYQETGRAGRDGLPSEAIMYFNGSDLASNRKDLQPDVRELCRSKTCIRRFLLRYFGFEDDKFVDILPQHDCCSICSTECECSTCTSHTCNLDLDLSMLSLDGNVQVDVDDSLSVPPSLVEKVRSRIVNYREELEDCHGHVSLTYGLTLEVINEICEKLDKITCIDDILPPATNLWGLKQAEDIFSIISEELGFVELV